MTDLLSASAFAIVKCTQLKGLADKSDYTCEYSTPSHPLSSSPSYPDSLQMERPTSSYGPSKPAPSSPLSNPIIMLTSIPNSIEADVVVIASCIPTLQPLLELIMGKRTLGSYNNGHSGRSKQSGSNYNPASFDRSKRSAARKDDVVITNLEGKESQESILPGDQFQQNKTYPMGAIRRTDNVTVEYESHTGPGEQHSRGSW